MKSTGRRRTLFLPLLGFIVLISIVKVLGTTESQGDDMEGQHIFGDDPEHGDGQTEEEKIVLTGSDICQMTGYFVVPHPCNCQLFYTWYQGVFVEEMCEPGLFFDALTLNCISPEEVTCADGFGPPPPPPVAPEDPLEELPTCPWQQETGENQNKSGDWKTEKIFIFYTNKDEKAIKLVIINYSSSPPYHIFFLAMSCPE